MRKGLETLLDELDPPRDENLVEGVAAIRAAMVQAGLGLWHERTVARWLNRGIVPGRRFGRRWQSRRSWLRELSGSIEFPQVRSSTQECVAEAENSE